VVDGQGRILWGDQLMQIWAEAVLKERPGAVVIADVKASQTLFDRIAALGGKPLMWKTGHSLIKNKMAETKAPLAGEMSGHIFFADRYYGFDDALYAAIRLLDVVAGTTEPVSAMRDRMAATINTPELRFQCSEEAKRPVMAAVVARLQAAGATYSDVDGVRVNTRTAGGCCAPPTPRTCWSHAPNGADAIANHLFALAENANETQKEPAFQASSPKNFPPPFGAAFFCPSAAH
jgi:phosphomannomutase